MIDYDAHDWRRHLFDIRGTMVREILARVALCVLWSAAIVYAHEERFPFESLAISDKAHGLIGVALGLLLVFRTNASYDRFWEGRKLWGAIVNETRNLARSASVLLAADPELAANVMRWTIAFPWATMHRLRGTSGPEAASVLGPDELREAAAAQHPPIAVACRITQLLTQARQRGLVSDYVQMALDQNVQLLIDYMGGCERIHRTPLPFSYVVHLRRALIFYCFTLPFALVGAYGWGTVPATLFIAYVLFGIEEIGVEIEDPFGVDPNDLPLEAICGTIERNVKALMDGLPRAVPGRDGGAPGEPALEKAPAS